MKQRKRLLAWIGIIFLLALYLATFIFSLIGSDWAFNMFKMCLGFTVVIPVLFYVYLMIYKLLHSDDTEKHTSGKETKDDPHDRI